MMKKKFILKKWNLILIISNKSLHKIIRSNKLIKIMFLNNLDSKIDPNTSKKYLQTNRIKLTNRSLN